MQSTNNLNCSCFNLAAVRRSVRQQRPSPSARLGLALRRQPAALSPATSGLRVTCGEQRGRYQGRIPASRVWIRPRPPAWDSGVSQEQLTLLGRIWRCRFPRKDVNSCWEEGKSHWVMVLGRFRAKSCPAEVLDRTGDAGRGGECYLCLLCPSGSADLHRLPAAYGHDPTPRGTRRRNRPRSCPGTLRERKNG